MHLQIEFTIEDRNENRILEFHDVLISADPDKEDVNKLLNEKFEESDYHSLLGSCIQDIEDEKTPVYANLLKSLIVDPVPLQKKRVFIEASKALSLHDLDYLREIYINGKYDLMTPGGSTQQVEGLLNTSDSIRKISKSRFVNFGFLEDDSSDISNLAKEFVQKSYKTDDLLPESIGRKPWTGITINIISFEIGNVAHSRIYDKMRDILWNRQIKSQVHILDSQRQVIYALSSGAILLVGDEVIKGKYLEGVEAYSTRKPMVRVDLTEKGSLQTLERVAFLDRYSLVDIREGNETGEVFDLLSKILA